MIAQAHNTVSSGSSDSSVLSTNGGWGIVNGTWTNVSKTITEIKGPIKVGDTEISNKLFELMIKDFLMIYLKHMPLKK